MGGGQLWEEEANYADDNSIPFDRWNDIKEKYHKLHSHFILRLSHNAQTLCGSHRDSCGGERALALVVGKGQGLFLLAGILLEC